MRGRGQGTYLTEIHGISIETEREREGKSLKMEVACERRPRHLGSRALTNSSQLRTRTKIGRRERERERKKERERVRYRKEHA